MLTLVSYVNPSIEPKIDQVMIRVLHLTGFLYCRLKLLRRLPWWSRRICFSLMTYQLRF